MLVLPDGKGEGVGEHSGELECSAWKARRLALCCLIGQETLCLG